MSCPLQVECHQEPGDRRQLTLTLQQQTVASDVEASPVVSHSECIRSHTYCLQWQLGDC